MSRSSRTDELPIIRAYYELTLWLRQKGQTMQRTVERPTSDGIVC